MFFKVKGMKLWRGQSKVWVFFSGTEQLDLIYINNLSLVVILGGWRCYKALANVSCNDTKRFNF